jgi:hypothetical protein
MIVLSAGDGTNVPKRGPEGGLRNFSPPDSVTIEAAERSARHRGADLFED